MSTLSLEQKIGQLFVIGFPGGEAGEASIRRVIQGRPFGNLILFGRNADKPDALRSRLSGLRSLIKERSGVLPLVAIDQEGGTVIRMQEGLTPLPGAMAMSSACLGKTVSLSDIEAMAVVSARELCSLGIDWNLAPDADVNINPANPIIGVRSFGEDPQFVAQMVSAYAKGLKKGGMVATAKHFPGHGDTNVDSHLGLPAILATPERLDAVELVPFRRLIADGVGSIMSAHVLFPALEPESLPATLSHRVLTGLLRERLGFGGVIITDCLEMKAVDGRYDRLAVRAFLAGADVLCVSHTAAKQEEAYDSILAAVRSGEIAESRVDASLDRILRAKAEVAKVRAEAGLTELASATSLALAGHIAGASVSVVSGRGLPDLGSGGLYVDLQPQALTGAEDQRLESMTVAESLRREDSLLDCIEVSCDPGEDDIENVIRRIGDRPVIVGVYAMSRYPSQTRLVGRIAATCSERGLDLGFVSMRDPYDAVLIAGQGGDGCAVLCAYEYTNVSSRAVARVLSGAHPVAGICPVRVVSA